MITTTKTMLRAAALAAVALIAAAPGATAADKEKLTIGMPGVPPVFGAVVFYVAKDVGIFDKYGLDVTVKAMDSGAAAANAVDSGSLDFSLSPSPFIATKVGNAGAKLKAIWGMEKSDWLIASMDPKKMSCDSMKGQGVGVDSPRGARWIPLNTYLVTKCKLVTDKDVPTVPLGTTVGTAMASGQLTFGVLHMDDVPVIERMSGKKVNIIADLETIAPDQHYLLGVVRADTLAKKRDAFVRFDAALRDAVAYMRDPKNADKVATIAAVTKREKADALHALKAYNAMEFWPSNHAGLTKDRVMNAVNSQARIGKITKGKSGINPAKKPPTYEQLVDLSVWADAEKLKK